MPLLLHHIITCMLSSDSNHNYRWLQSCALSMVYFNRTYSLYCCDHRFQFKSAHGRT